MNWSLRSLAVVVGLGLVAATHAAHADDEGSEHSAVVMGADDDTRGLTLVFAERTGWTATFRSAPGVAPKQLTLPLPRDHAHFVVHVGPGRRGFTIVETSIGRTGPGALPATRPVAWHFDQRGRLTRTWRYRQVVPETTRAAPRVTAGHLAWTERTSVLGDTLVLATSDLRHDVVVDTKRAAIRLVLRPPPRPPAP